MLGKDEKQTFVSIDFMTQKSSKHPSTSLDQNEHAFNFVGDVLLGLLSTGLLVAAADINHVSANRGLVILGPGALAGLANLLGGLLVSRHGLTLGRFLASGLGLALAFGPQAGRRRLVPQSVCLNLRQRIAQLEFPDARHGVGLLRW